MFSESTGNGSEVVVSMQIGFLFRACQKKTNQRHFSMVCGINANWFPLSCMQKKKQINNIFPWSVILSTIEMMLMIQKTTQ